MRRADPDIADAAAACQEHHATTLKAVLDHAHEYCKVSPNQRDVMPLACLGRCMQAPQLAMVQSHLQMFCTGVHEHSLQMRCWQSERRLWPPLSTQSHWGRGSSHASVWPGAPRPRLSTTLSTAKAVYKSNRGCHHVPRRRHTNLTVAATTCREGGIQI